LASVTGFTKERLQEIEDTTVVGGSVNSMGNLILATREGIQIDAGYVRGQTGDIGPDRPLVAGIIQAFGGTTPPSGWLFCNGAAISRTIYADLFAAIGTTYGSGDGFLSFNLPDLRGRVPVGFTASETEFNAMGKTGGEKSHILTENEMPSHTHTVQGFKGVDDSNFSGNNGRLQASDYLTPYDQFTSATGGGEAHNNLQPYNTVHYIISIGNVGSTVGTPAEDYVGRGSTAQRDALYGIPGDDSTRVALANRKIVWFNTDTGWEESYYATTGKLGLAVQGLLPQASSGWYPIGPAGPSMLWEATAQTTPAADSFLGSWGWVRKRGGATWWGSDPLGTKVKIMKHGRYAIRGWTTQGTGSGTSNWHLRIQSPEQTTVLNVDGNAFPQNAALYTRVHIELDDMVMNPGQYVGMLTTNGGLAMHVGSAVMGQFSVRYLGPPLELE